MNKYESIYIISPLADEEQFKSTIEKFSYLISEHGEIEKVEEWAGKSLLMKLRTKRKVTM